MQSNVRAVAAAVAIAHTTNRRLSSVYDYRAGRHRSMAVSVNGMAVSAYDYQDGCHISGSLPGLHHYGVGAYLTLTPKSPGSYSGYDYGRKCHFSISVTGAVAEVYDYGESSHFRYSA